MQRSRYERITPGAGLLLILSCMAILVPLLAFSVSAEDPWPSFKNGPARASECRVNDTGASGLVWRYGGVNIGSYTAPKSSAIIVGDSVFFGADTGKMYCVGRENGELRWSYQTENTTVGIHSTPAYSHGRLFFGGYDHKIYCLDASDGSPIWSFDTHGWCGASGCVVNDTLFISGDAGAGELYSFNATTGMLNWRYSGGNDMHSSPAVDAERGLVFVGSNDACLHAVWLKNGTMAWKYHSGREIKGTPAVDHDRGLVYIGSWDHNVYAVHEEDGSVAWTFRSCGMIYSSPALDPGRGRLYIGSFDNGIYCLDMDSGGMYWRFATDGAVLSSPSLEQGSGRLFVGSNDGRLYCIDSANGRMLWAFGSGDKITSSPALADNMVIISSCDGYVYAMHLNMPCSFVIRSYHIGAFILVSLASVLLFAVYISGRSSRKNMPAVPGPR